MFLLRIGFIAVVAIMLLPRGPAEDRDQGGFCDRYPKTCEASVELATAFGQKLSYGITLARRSLESQPYGPAASGPATSGWGNSQALPFGPSNKEDRVGEWRPENRGNTERSTEWRLNN